MTFANAVLLGKKLSSDTTYECKYEFNQNYLEIRNTAIRKSIKHYIKR